VIRRLTEPEAKPQAIRPRPNCPFLNIGGILSYFLILVKEKIVKIE